MDDMYLTKLALKEVKRMEERKQQEKLAKQDQILQNFLIRINEELEKQSSVDEIDILVNSYALFVNTMIKLKKLKRGKK